MVAESKREWDNSRHREHRFGGLKSDADARFSLDDSRVPERKSTSVPTLVQFLREAVRAVPAVRYALGVGGVAAVAAIVYSFRLNPGFALVGTVITFVLMGVLLIFARASALAGIKLQLPALVFAWFTLLLFMATSTLLFTGVFIGKPLNLQSILVRAPDKPDAQSDDESETRPTDSLADAEEPAAPDTIDATWVRTLPSGWSGYANGWFGKECACASPSLLPFPSLPYQPGSVVELPNRCSSAIEVAVGKLEPTSTGLVRSVARAIVAPRSVFQADVGGAMSFDLLLRSCPVDP